MKKILAMILVLASVLALGGCMTAGTNTATATDPTNPEKISYENYSCTLDGLCDYLNDMGYMVYDYDASKDEAGTSTIKMNAEMIGAEAGYKSSYTYDGDKWVVEVYYYKDTNSDLYKEAQSGTFTFDEVEDGSFDITVNNQFALVVNEPKKGEERKAAIIEAFNNFYPQGE